MDNIYRILDVNINRLSEGLRVIEETCRFFFNDESLTNVLKQYRQLLNSNFRSLEDYKNLLLNRDIENDVGSNEKFDDNNIERTNVIDILRANFKRAEESSRVLEEYSKVLKKDFSFFKNIRFNLYKLEKEVISKLIKEIENGNTD